MRRHYKPKQLYRFPRFPNNVDFPTTTTSVEFLNKKTVCPREAIA